jgi:hypothetical protein
MTTSNYPPDYEAIKHTIDDPVEEIEEVGEFDESDDFRDNQPEEDEIPLFDEDE